MSKMSDTYRLVARKGTWYYRRRVPDHLQAAIGRDIIQVSLGTKHKADTPEEHPARKALPADSFIGHIHFRSNQRDKVFDFYANTLGFRPNANAPAFKFCDVGTERRGHMIAFNAWAGDDLPRPSPDSPGVERFTIRVPDAGALRAVGERLQAGGHRAAMVPEGLLTQDPDGNVAVLTVMSH